MAAALVRTSGRSGSAVRFGPWYTYRPMTARRISTPRFDIVTATAQHLLVETDDVQKLGKLLGAEVPAEWPPYPAAALQKTLDQTQRGPDQIGWWSRYVVLRGGAGARVSDATGSTNGRQTSNR